MTIKIRGVEYDYAENIAEKYEYSIFHIRHLAREYGKGRKGLRGFKHRGRWVISLIDAENKLSVEKRMESLKNDDGTDTPEESSIFNGYDCLQGL